MSSQHPVCYLHGLSPYQSPEIVSTGTSEVATWPASGNRREIGNHWASTTSNSIFNEGNGIELDNPQHTRYTSLNTRPRAHTRRHHERVRGLRHQREIPARRTPASAGVRCEARAVPGPWVHTRFWNEVTVRRFGRGEGNPLIRTATIQHVGHGRVTLAIDPTTDPDQLADLQNTPYAGTYTITVPANIVHRGTPDQGPDPRLPPAPFPLPPPEQPARGVQAKPGVQARWHDVPGSGCAARGTTNCAGPSRRRDARRCGHGPDCERGSTARTQAAAKAQALQNNI